MLHNSIILGDGYGIASLMYGTIMGRGKDALCTQNTTAEFNVREKEKETLESCTRNIFSKEMVHSLTLWVITSTWCHIPRVHLYI